MKKIYLLLFIIACAFSSQAQTLVTGQIFPVPVTIAPLEIDLFFTNSTTTLTTTVQIDGMGYFNDTSSISGNSYVVTASFVDCQGNTVTYTANYIPPSAITTGHYDFGVLDWCSSSSGANASGQFSNSSSPISLNISYDNGLTYTTILSDSTGYFSNAISGLSTSGYAILSFDDCNGTTIIDTAYNISSSAAYEVFNFGTINFCNGAGTNPLNIYGQISPVTTPVSFTISNTHPILGVTMTYTFITDSLGNFNEDISVYGTSGQVVLSFANCNNMFQFANENYNSVNVPLDFGTIDFCPTTSTGSYINISGQMSPNPGSISYTIEINGNTLTGMTDSSGVVSLDSVQVSSLPNVIYISFTDCNGNIAMDTAYPSVILPFPAPYDFGIINYCPNVVNPPVSCLAGFTVNQAVIIDSFGNVISPGIVFISNNSVGQNLTYTWDFGDGSPTYTGVHFLHTYAGVGPYSLCLTVNSPATAASPACTATYCDSLTVDTNGVLIGKTNSGFSIQMGDGSDESETPTSINTIENTISEFNIFPNPANDFISISYNASQREKVEFNIYDLTGNLVQKNDLEASSKNEITKIQLNKLNKGIYLVQLKTAKGMISKKLSIK